MSIPSVWYCEGCKHRGLETTFKTEDGQHVCPKCNNEDDVFPIRWFKCDMCDYSAEQEEFFQNNELGKDDHPIRDHRLKPICPNDDCPSHEDEKDWRKPNSTTVTEVPVPGIAA